MAMPREKEKMSGKLRLPVFGMKSHQVCNVFIQSINYSEISNGGFIGVTAKVKDRGEVVQQLPEASTRTSDSVVLR